MIQFLSQHNIDRRKWDSRVNSADNAFLYSFSLYQDLFSDHWGGLIFGDYQAVMAVPYKVKFGIKYAYTPVGIAQLGIVGEGVNRELESEFIISLHKEFKYGKLHLNPFFSSQNAEKFKMSWKDNFVLNLSDGYEAISKRYTKDARKNLRAAAQFSQYTSPEVGVNQIRIAFMNQYGERGNTARLTAEYISFSKGLEVLIENGLAFKLAVKSEEDELLGAGVFGKFKNRLYYLFGAPSELGKKHGSMHVLIDAVIKQYANSAYSLDFEGSSIPSVATFYKKFSPVNEPYPLYQFNRLPALVRLFKK